jgi:hypothetical protein
LKDVGKEIVKDEIQNQINVNKPILSFLPEMTTLLSLTSTEESPDMPTEKNFFDAINPFPSSASIRTTAECGVCRWGTWLIRETIGSKYS